MDSLPSLETIVALAKRRGFVFPTSEIYGGLVSSYDYGPLGTELLRNIRNLWWEEMINRLFLMMLCDAYWEDKDNQRIVLRFKPWLAPYKVAVFPLLKNRPELVDKARSIFTHLSQHISTTWDERGNIGKRYYYQDEIGTPCCVTVDFQTLEDDTATVRDRDTTGQVRVAVGELLPFLQERTLHS